MLVTASRRKKMMASTASNCRVEMRDAARFLERKGLTSRTMSCRHEAQDEFANVIMSAVSGFAGKIIC
jgi:hypothetical protein